MNARATATGFDRHMLRLMLNHARLLRIQLQDATIQIAGACGLDPDDDVVCDAVFNAEDPGAALKLLLDARAARDGVRADA